MSRPFLVLCLAVLVGLLGVMSIALQKSSRPEAHEDDQQQQNVDAAKARRDQNQAKDAQRKEKTANFKTGLEIQKKREAKFQELAAKRGAPDMKFSASNSMEITGDWMNERQPGAAGIDKAQKEKELREQIMKEVDAAVPMTPNPADGQGKPKVPGH
jgi:type III secretory pathway component EscV